MIPAVQLVAPVAGGASGEPDWAVSACRIFVVLMYWRTVMDGRQFDALTRLVAHVGSRRQALRWPLAASLGGLLIAASPKGAAAACLENGARCGGDRGTCCSGWCKRRNGKKRCRPALDQSICTTDFNRCLAGQLLGCNDASTDPNTCQCTITVKGRSRCSDGDVRCVDCDNDADCVDHATEQGLPRPDTWHCLSCPGCGARDRACAASCENPV